jgi:hypothetical protein
LVGVGPGDRASGRPVVPTGDAELAGRRSRSVAAGVVDLRADAAGRYAFIDADLGPSTARLARALMIERRERADMIDSTETTDPTESTDAADPIEPIDNTEPTEPTERNEPRHPMQSTESSDHNDHFELTSVPIARSPTVASPR